MNLAHNEKLRELVNERLKEIFKKQSELIRDAEKRGMTISKSRLSKYLTGSEGPIKEEQVLWIAERLGIQVHLNFGQPTMEKGKLKYEVVPYDEKAALNRLNKIFR